MSISHRKPEDEIWYVHAPLKNEKRPIVPTVQPSNIPYLNGIMDTEEEINKQQTIWFKDTDSEFVKLSKLGGRQDLLIHRVKENPKEPVGYPIPSWWTDMLTEVVTEKKEDNDPYEFHVPAWFAHQDKSNVADLRVREHKMDQSIKKQMAKHETIEEPRKYGQLRNYLNPVKMKSSPNRQENVNLGLKQKHTESTTTMLKLMSNHYQQERPRDYNEWKNKNLESLTGTTSRGSITLK